MKDFFHSTVKKVTLELIYDAVDERTKGIKEDVGKLDGRIQNFEGKVQHLESEMNRRFDSMQSEMNRRFEAMDQKFAVVDQKFNELNSRFDQLFAILINQRPLKLFKECITTINILTTIDENFIVPDTISFKYKSMGLKPADAFSAAYTELVKANILVSENRHFLARHGSLPFKVLTAAKTLRLL